VNLGIRVSRSVQPLTEAWQNMPVEPRGSTPLGISFRRPVVDTLGLEPRSTLDTLLGYPFEVIRLGAYWDRIEPAPGVFDPSDLDWQVEAAAHAGKRIVLAVGALKTFGYPEFFAPAHRVGPPLPERTRIRPAAYTTLLDAATEFVSRIVSRYAECSAVVAWQVEHESVDPLGMEHSWRLDEAFVFREIEAVRRTDPTRPVLLNGFLPVSPFVRVSQWFQTRDQGDSIDVAQRHADIVGLDYYPRHALVRLGPLTVYAEGDSDARPKRVFAWARHHARRLMISEGQAEPWEAVTRPPNPPGRVMYSCPPDQVIASFNTCMRWAQAAGVNLEGYLFWGAEYWVLRSISGDSSYLKAFERVLSR
jgi:hypothetical protein